MSSERDYVPAHLAIEAMRDNGYKNTAYAIAELVDNSVQADASRIDVICGEREQLVDQRHRRRVESIGVVDDGTGMEFDELWDALQFGNGTRLESGKRSGIGRFGMGLPASSISQCKKLEVWTWQDDPDHPLYTYLDIPQIKNQRTLHVPEPVERPIPEMWREVCPELSDTGTLVVWSVLDRLMWKTARAIIDNSEELMGRIYRRFIHHGNIQLRLAAFDVENPADMSLDRFALPNDPLYLMAPSSCPDPYSETPMFQEWGEPIRKTYRFRGVESDVVLRFSYAREDAREGDLPGQRPYGKHAAKNVGLSIVRAGRELELDQSLVIQYDPTERWWGAELEFQPPLDDLFGLTNNKQSARHFAEIAKLDAESFIEEEGQTIHQFKAQLEAADDPRLPLWEIKEEIESNLRQIRRHLQAQTKGKRGRQKRQRHEAEETATARTRDRQKQGRRGSSDEDEQLPPEERKKSIQMGLQEQGVEERMAEELAAQTVDDGMKYQVTEAPLDGPAFFNVRPRGGTLIVTLNINHPAYKHLVEVVESDLDSASKEQLADRLRNASRGIELLLMAWARYEDELEDGRMKEWAMDARTDWGKVARDFLRSDG